MRDNNTGEGRKLITRLWYYPRGWNSTEEYRKDGENSYLRSIQVDIRLKKHFLHNIQYCVQSPILQNTFLLTLSLFFYNSSLAFISFLTLLRFTRSKLVSLFVSLILGRLLYFSALVIEILHFLLLPYTRIVEKDKEKIKVFYIWKIKEPSEKRRDVFRHKNRESYAVIKRTLSNRNFFDTHITLFH